MLEILLPELFLSSSLILLLTFAVIYAKVNGKYSQQYKITILSIIVLLITLILNFNNFNIIFYDEIFYSNSLIVFFKVLILLSSIVVLFWSFDFYKKDNLTDFEFPLLILFACLGMLFLVSSHNLLMFYLSIELFSLSLYVLATFQRDKYSNTEAGLKYFLLGALSSGILLLGCTLLYLYTGEITFYGIHNFIYFSYSDQFPTLLGGLFLIIGILFKLAAAPFHNWAPDVYEGTSTIITGFFSIVPKLATFSVLITLLYYVFNNLDFYFILVISIISSFIIGSIGGLYQTKIKRLFAYSAIGHVGFILLGLISGYNLLNLQSSLIYLVIYIIMNFITFSILLYFYDNNITGNFIVELSGLSRFNPIIAITFVLNLLSLAGIPPLAGFFSKFLIFMSALQNEFYILSLIAIVGSVISCFYYLRVIKWIYMKHNLTYTYKNLADITIKRNNINLVNSLILGISLFIIISFILYPNPIFIISFDVLSNFII